MRAFLSLLAVAFPLVSQAAPPQSVIAPSLPQSVLAKESAAPYVSPRGHSKPGTWDVLRELNEQRAERGLPPYIWDADLTLAAASASEYRASRLMFGHCDDFAHLPQGATAEAAGCAAYPASYGFMACACYEAGSYHAGACYTLGTDNKRYCQLFIRPVAGASRERTVIRSNSGPTGTQATVRSRFRSR